MADNIFRGVHTAEEFGAVLKQERTAQGLSIAELARRSDVSASTISKLEAGCSNSYLSTIIRVVRALGHCKDLFGQEL